MSHWTPDSLPWSSFDRTRTDPAITDVIGGLALVESRADLYGDYLQRVLSSRFNTHPEWSATIARWSSEEDQHGITLRRWYQLARPNVDIDAALERYLADVAYHDDTTTQSVRGSVEQELVCRCVIEALATTLYLALASKTQEPVLQQALRRLAADEARHYRLFFDLLQVERREHGTDHIGTMRAMHQRLRALDDEQIMQASHAATGSTEPFCRQRTRARLLPHVYGSYDDVHIQTLARLLGRVVGVSSSMMITIMRTGGSLYLRGKSAWLRRPHAPAMAKTALALVGRGISPTLAR